METALNRLGLVILRPQQGEPYNAAYHTAIGSAGTQVSRCITPGVIVQGAKEALLKADVALQ